MAVGSAAARYAALETARQPFLDRARRSAKLTIPTLVPPAGHSSHTKYSTPNQSIGARGVNNMASKLLLTLFPPNSPFFRYLIDDFMLIKMTKRQDMRGQVEKALGSIERSIMTEMEGRAVRVSLFEALKQLIVAGNVLLYIPPEGKLRVFRMDRYVIKRDPMGNELEIITEEDVAPNVLPKNIQALVKGTMKSEEKTAKLHTWVVRRDGQWHVHQEVNGIVVPGSKGTYPLDNSAFIPLRWTAVDGEDWGRGYIEEYYGDLSAVDKLRAAIVQGSAAAAKIIFLVDPNGTTSMKVIANAETGSVRPGRREDVTTVQSEKQADMSIAQTSVQALEQSLAFAFLLNTAIQRKGERVTAEEIRYMAGELEDALGGIYSLLSQELQLPLVSRLSFQMERQKRLPTLPKGMVRPAITTGLEALGRGHDMNKLQLFSEGAAAAAQLPPEVKREEFLSRYATAIGIDTNGLVKTPDELAAEMDQQQKMALMDKLGPKGMEIIKELIAKGEMNGQSAPNNQAAPAG